MKKRKILLSALLAASMFIGTAAVNSENVYAEGVLQFQGAEEVSYDELIKTATIEGDYAGGEDSRNVTNANMKLTLDKSGKLEIFADANEYCIFDEAGVEIFRCTPKGGYEDVFVILKKGTYYVAMLSSYEAKAYKFTYAFTPSEESFEESYSKNNDDISRAEKISYGKNYKGQTGTCDIFDYYKLKVPMDGQLTLNYSYSDPVHGWAIAEPYPVYDLKNADNASLFRGNIWEAKTGTFNFSVTKGDYYLNLLNEVENGNAGFFYDFNVSYSINAKSEITSATKKGNKLVIKSKKVSGVDGYEVSYSTSNKFTKAATKKVNVKKTGTIKGVKKGTYYVKVRPYITVDGVKCYGQYSDVVTVK